MTIPVRPLPDTSSTGLLVSEVLGGLSRLVRGEVALARAEVEAKLQDSARGALHLVWAAVIAMVALNVLAGVLIAALVKAGIDPLWASGGVGVGLLLLAGGFAQFGLQRMTAGSLIPERALRNLRRDAETLKEVVTKDATP